MLSSTALAQTWLGGSGNNWSTGANWSGGSAPANDGTASIEFSPAGTTYTPVVDVPWGIAAMTFTSPGYSLGGMALTFAGSAFITVKDPGNRIANAVAIPTGLTIEGHEDFLISGDVSGAGTLHKAGSGTLTLSGATWPTGQVTVAEGTLRIGDGTTGPASVGALLVDGAVSFADSTTVTGTIAGGGRLTVEAGATVTNTSGAAFTHAGSTGIHGHLTGSPAGSIDNNAPLTIGPSGELTTAGGEVGSLSGNGFLNLTSGTFRAGSDNSSTTFSGVLGGPGNFTKTGTGTLTLQTSFWFNTSSVVTVEAGGTLRIGSAFVWPGAVGPLVANGHLAFAGHTSVLEALTGTGSVTVELDANVTNQSTEPFRHQGPTNVYGILTGAAAGSIDNNAPLTLGPLGNLNTSDGTVGSLSGSGFLFIGAGNFAVGSDNSSTTFAGAIGGSGSLTKAGGGTLTLSGNSQSFGGTTTVTAGGLSVSGWLGGPVVVAAGASLEGTGTLGAITLAAGGALAPGPGPSDLATGSLSLAGTYTAQLFGGVPGSQHDRLVVTGSVALNGATLVLSGGYVPNLGDQIVLIANDGSEAVTGTFAGLPEGSTIVFNGRTLRISYAGGSGNDVVLSVASHTVTPSVNGGNGTIAPVTPQTVAAGATVAFTLAPSPGYVASVGGTCGGTLSGNTFTTSPVTADCTVVAGFAPATYAVTPSAGPNGTIAPGAPQTVAHGATASFTVTPNAGYTASVGGTCGGTLTGTTYVTNAITSDCTVAASFTAINHVVTPSAGPNGSISPATPQAVAHGATTTFTVTPAPGYAAAMGGSCGGSLVATTFTTSPITADCTVAATFAVVNRPRLANISTRMQVLTGNDVLIGGFIIAGFVDKTVVVRARGPSLVPFGIANALANPQLQLVRSSDQATIASNDNWQAATNAAALAASGFAPSNDLEAAILVKLPPGAYTALVSGVGGTTGVGIVEVFEVDAPEAPVENISTRGQVRTGNDAMIGGFVIEGSTHAVVVRARGPSLVPFGIANALANPRLTLVRSSDQQVIATNDDWQSDPGADALTSSGFAPSNPLEAAVRVVLPPGAYTVIVTGVGDTTGVAIVEVFSTP